MLPIENSVAGRVADIHHLLPNSGLYIVGEHFQRVQHHLLALPGASLRTIKTVRSHVHALSQCRNAHPPARPQAGGRRRHRRGGGRGGRNAATRAWRRSPPNSPARSTASSSLKRNIEDEEHNTTRFLIMAREPAHAAQ